MRRRKVIREVLDYGDKNEHTPLHVAAYFGNYKMVRHFLKHGANQTKRDIQGHNPLDLSKDKFCRKVLSNLNEAAYTCNDNNLKHLVNCGNKIDEKLSIFGEAPIHKAVLSEEAHNVETLKAIIECEADVENIDANGWTALHHACYKGDFNTAQVLIDAGANVNSFSNSKKSPIHLACLNNNYTCLNLLLSRKAYIESITEEDCTPLHLAAKRGNLQCVEMLLTNYANIKAKDFRSWTPLHYAAYNGYPKVINYLLAYDADFEQLRDMRNSQHRKAFEICKDPKTKEGFKIIWKASLDGDLDLIRNLFREGHDINKPTQHNKNTALHIAVGKQHYLVIKFLLESGASPQIANSEGKLPIHYVDVAENMSFGQDQLEAQRKGEKIRELLIKSGGAEPAQPLHNDE